MYALGYLGISIFFQTTVKWYQYFYSPPELNQGGYQSLIPLGFVGLAMIIARIFDGIADPLVAYYSDRSKNKKGRRIPFIFIGSFPLALSFILLWFPPVEGVSIINFIYLTFILSLFFIFFTVVVGPYLALIGEISKTNKERINLTMMQGITQILGVMIAEAGSGALINFYNFKIMGIVLGLLALFTILLTPLFVKEDPANINTQQVNMSKSIKMTIANKDFLFYLISYSAVWFGINTLTISMPYIFEVLLKSSAETSGYVIAGAFILALLFSPFLPKISLTFGKKLTLQIASLMFALILFLIGLFGTVFPITAAAGIIILSGIPLSVIFIVPNAMIADIAEVDGIRNGIKREGMFFGAQGLIIKIIIGLSSLVTPLIFQVFGSNPGQYLGLQIVGPLAGVLIIFSLYFLRKYSLAEKRE